MFSHLLTKLPRAGSWTVWVEHLFGFMLLGVALYFIAPLLSAAVVAWSAAGLALCAGIYLGFVDRNGGDSRAFRVIKKGVAAACLLIAVLAVFPAEPQQPLIDWQAYDAAALQDAAEQGRPVLVYFTADWCPPCQEMSRTTWRDRGVAEASTNLLMVKADVTHIRSPEARKLIEKYSVPGVPTLIFLDAQGAEVEELRTVGYLGPREFVAAVDRLG